MELMIEKLMKKGLFPLVVDIKMTKKQTHITGDKLKNVNKRLINNKFVEIGAVHTKMMKECGVTGLSWLLEICKRAWSKGRLAED